MLFVELHQAQFVVWNCLVPQGFCGLYIKINLLGLLTFDSAYYLTFVTERMGLFNLWLVPVSQQKDVLTQSIVDLFEVSC